MPSDSGYVSIGPKNRQSFIQWKPQHSLSLDSSISAPMSKHIHSTTRRIFIGPTPLNWSYKKSSLWFSKSDQAIHHKGPNRQRTFRAEPENKGPANMSSLDFYRDPNNSTTVHLTDKPFLVSEPEEILISESSSSLFDNEVFYTPHEEMRPFPATPPHHRPRNWYTMPETEYLFNDTQLKHFNYFNFTQTPIECINEEVHSDHIQNEIENVHKNNVEDEPSNIAKRAIKFADLDNSELRPIYKSGTIIKEDRMLIRIERLFHRGTPKRYSGHFLKGHTSRKYVAQSAGWKEFIVKLRPGMIELYKSEKIRCFKMRFSEKIRLSLFSAIDYTITIKQQTDYGKKVLLMNPNTIEKSIEWYRVLHTALGEPLVKPIPSICEVYVPDLDVHVRIPLEKCTQAHQITAEDVTKLVLDELSGEPEWDDVLHEWLKSCDLRLCWKRYDRLEWIVWEKNEDGKSRNDLLACPQFIEGTHQLQLRPTEHYPTSIHSSDGTKLSEPPPIEGYLIRVTNNEGKWKPKRLYFTSHDHYLFFLKPLAISPPPPPVPSSTPSSAEDQQYAHPLIYAVAPQLQEEFAQNDAFMKADAKRRLKQIVNAIGFINLVDVVEVKFFENSNSGHKVTESENYGCPFELVLNNGKNVILQSYSRQTMDEWIKRLNELMAYWKGRIKMDIKIRTDMFKANEDYHHEDDDNTNQDELYISHWNNFHAYVNPTIWNWCVLNGCRGITKGGLFYHKSHFHGSFRNYYHILTRGHLLYYKLYKRRSLDKVAIRRSFNKRRGCIDLADCYIYSGSITEYDLLYSSTSRFSIKNDEAHKLPRIYSDGMCCYDNDEECTFVIWQGKKKFYFGKDEIKKGRLKKKTMLDQPGNIWVFRARSRIEREEWVLAINVEIERACREREKDNDNS